MFVATKICLLRQKFVAASILSLREKMILVAAPANDTRVLSKADRIGRANELAGNGSVTFTPRVRAPDGCLSHPPVRQYIVHCTALAAPGN